MGSCPGIRTCSIRTFSRVGEEPFLGVGERSAHKRAFPTFPLIYPNAAIVTAGSLTFVAQPNLGV